jgi:hypothetical protein
MDPRARGCIVTTSSSGVGVATSSCLDGCSAGEAAPVETHDPQQEIDPRRDSTTQRPPRD